MSVFFFFNILFFFFIIFFKSFSIITCLWFVYFLEIQNFWYSNHSLFLFDLFLHDYNTLLTNNLNKYHPYFLYESSHIVLVAFHLFFYYYLAFKKDFFVAPYCRTVYLLTTMGLMAVIFFALFLGAWWAQQENSWGGWWNWDSSETLGLLLLVFISIFLHNNFLFWKKFSEINYMYAYLFFYSTFIIAYLLVQLSFELTSHNFGIKFFYFFNNNFLFSELIYFFVFSIIWMLSLFVKIKIRIYFWQFFIIFVEANSFKNKLKFILYKNLYLWLIWITVCLVLIYSFFQPLNFFFWNFLHINIFDNVNNFEFFLFFIFLTALPGLTFFYSNFWINLFVLFFFFIPYFFFYTFMWNRNLKSFITHFFIILFFISQIVAENSYFLYETFYFKYPNFTYESFLVLPLNASYVTNFVFLEKFFPLQVPSSVNSINFLTNVHHRGGVNDKFSFVSTCCSFVNFIFVNINYFSNTIWNELIFLPNIFFFSWVFLFKLWVKVCYFQNCITELNIKPYQLRFCSKIACLSSAIQNIGAFFPISD